jgi:Cytochrome P450
MVKYTRTAPAKAIPYIREYPLVGSLPAFLGDRLKFLLCMAEKNDVYGFHIGLVPMILFNKPEHVQSILVEHADDFYKGRCYAYIPFGAGPRICIGNYFALMEGQLLIATLAQRVTFALVPGQTIEPDPLHNLALRPGGKVKALVKRR